MSGDQEARGRMEFFALKEPVKSTSFRGDMESADWPSTIQLYRGEFTPDRPIVVRRSSGGRVADFIWTTWAIPIIVSERVVNLFREQRFTGWATYPVEVYNTAKSLIPGYYGLAITGRCQKTDWTQSQRVLKEYPAGRFPVWRGLHISGWDGSDLFMSNNGAEGYKFVTDRVRVALERAKIRNVEIRSTNDLETDTDPAHE